MATDQRLIEISLLHKGVFNSVSIPVGRLLTQCPITYSEKEGKSWILSLIAHLVLIALLFLPIIVTQTPQPEPEGVMISLGMPDEGQGDEPSNALEGISKGSGRVGGGLGNRGVLYEPKISDGSQKTGRVVISVCVDKKGKVIKADYTQKGSTTTDSELKDIARRATLQFKFTDADIEEQCGTITVDFKIRGS